MFFGPLMRMSLIVGSFSSDFQRAQAEGLVQHLADQLLALVAVQQRVFAVAEVLDHQADLAAEHVAFQLADLASGRACRPACCGSAA